MNERKFQEGSKKEKNESGSKIATCKEGIRGEKKQIDTLKYGGINRREKKNERVAKS